MSLWDGMPEFGQEDRKPAQSIVVHFASQEDVNTFAALTGYVLTPRSRSIWFPFRDRQNLKAFVYRDEEGDRDVPR